MWPLSPPSHKLTLISPSEALTGRDTPIESGEHHALTGRPLKGPHPTGCERFIFAMGCFWGAERLFWRQPGVYATAVGYTGGYTPHPTYQEVCSGRTAHTEAVEVIYNPQEVSLEALLELFWSSHDPTQGMRQGNDLGTQYRSALFWTTEAQRAAAQQSLESFQAALERTEGHSAEGERVTTTIAEAGPFYYAEEAHQQYLHKHPNGYCGLRGTGVSCALS